MCKAITFCMLPFFFFFLVRMLNICFQRSTQVKYDLGDYVKHQRRASNFQRPTKICYFTISLPQTHLGWDSNSLKRNPWAGIRLEATKGPKIVSNELCGGERCTSLGRVQVYCLTQKVYQAFVHKHHACILVFRDP